MIKFLWNGIKGSDGKLQKADIYFGRDGVIIVSADSYDRFSHEIKKEVQVTNETDSMRDFFDNDRFVLSPEHRLYPAAFAAIEKREMHDEKLRERRKLKWGV